MPRVVHGTEKTRKTIQILKKMKYVNLTFDQQEEKIKGYIPVFENILKEIGPNWVFEWEEKDGYIKARFFEKNPELAKNLWFRFNVNFYQNINLEGDKVKVYYSNPIPKINENSFNLRTCAHSNSFEINLGTTFNRMVSYLKNKIIDPIRPHYLTDLETSMGYEKHINERNETAEYLFNKYKDCSFIHGNYNKGDGIRKFFLGNMDNADPLEFQAKGQSIYSDQFKIYGKDKIQIKVDVNTETFDKIISLLYSV